VKRAGHSLRLVAAALQGEPPRSEEWPAVIETANRGWLGPALYVALHRNGALAQAPEDVRDYLGLLHKRNRERNRRLRAQLIEAAGALNSHGIQPVLLKGAVKLFLTDVETLGARMLSDLDIGIAPDEAQVARSALMALGYYVTDSGALGRSCDAGVIDLHDRPNVRAARYLDKDLRVGSPLVERDGVVARIPSHANRAVHLIVHDMIKEGDYWRLRINPRHLNDLAEMAGSAGGVDWAAVSAVLSDGRGRRALELQAIALQDLFGVFIPIDLRGRPIDRVRHAARLAAGGKGTNAMLIRLFGNLSWAVRCLADGFTRRGSGHFGRRAHLRLFMRARGSTL
jgi:hypothetical protein